MKVTKLFFGIALLSVASGALAQVTKSGSGYLIRMKFVKGQVMKYDMTIKATQGGQTMNMTMPMVSTVTNVANGIGTMSTKIGPLLVNGKRMAPVRTQTIKRDSKGNLVGGAGNVPGMSTVGYPPKPLPIGGTWKAKTKTAVGSAGMMDVEATYKLLGLESVGGRQTMKMSVALLGTGNAKVTGTNMLWVAVADGSLVKSVTNMKVTIGQQTVPMTMNIVRK